MDMRVLKLRSRMSELRLLGLKWGSFFRSVIATLAFWLASPLRIIIPYLVQKD
jgi:hypothetical protein